MLSATLLAAAAAVLWARPPAARRLTRISPVVVATAERQGPPRLLFVATGFVLWWVLGGMLGILLGGGLAVCGPGVVARLDDGDPEGEQLAAHLPLALDLLGACLSGGANLRDAVTAVAAALPGACGTRFSRIAAALAVGSPPDEAFLVLGDDRGPAGTAARALARCAEGGAPVAAAVLRIAQDARAAARVQAEKRAKRAGILAVGPLGACFLPAFLLLGVVPTVIGLAAPLLQSF